jgi:hypothetical protein
LRNARGLTLTEAMLAFVLFSVAMVPVMTMSHGGRVEVKDAAVLCGLLSQADAGTAGNLTRQGPLTVVSVRVAEAPCELVVHRTRVDPAGSFAPAIVGEQP